ncbi:DUF3870 domain-containing protein [Tissierella sp. MSJ-40]|uniref:DUF3870 domain-containing protein n=1 Tax=Tissierella simiarum TaxID=2841534 RepID=A0ABS6E8R3_9FIRM|nr:DUF3870 domain-containing protein [Tissierella simiarum]MBU5439307.1 DUF3870 domain-containing protein [Tissierella simiarum]
MREVKDYGPDTVYFVSYSKLPEDISATYVHKVVGVGFLINTKTGIIEDVMVTLISDLCKDFLAYLMIGHNIERDGIDELIEKVDKRFFGSSQKAIIVGIKGAYAKYIQWKQANRG